jgi:hypothetical protein
MSKPGGGNNPAVLGGPPATANGAPAASGQNRQPSAQPDERNTEDKAARQHAPVPPDRPYGN